MDIKFTMVMNKTIARKMSYIGKYHGRSRIKEIEEASKAWIQNFEQTNGAITDEDIATSLQDHD